MLSNPFPSRPKLFFLHHWEFQSPKILVQTQLLYLSFLPKLPFLSWLMSTGHTGQSPGISPHSQFALCWYVWQFCLPGNYAHSSQFNSVLPMNLSGIANCISNDYLSYTTAYFSGFVIQTNTLNATGSKTQVTSVYQLALPTIPFSRAIPPCSSTNSGTLPRLPKMMMTNQKCGLG